MKSNHLSACQRLIILDTEKLVLGALTERHRRAMEGVEKDYERKSDRN